MMTKKEKEQMLVDNEIFLASLGLKLQFSKLTIYGLVTGKILSNDVEYGEFHFRFKEYIPEQYFQMIVAEAYSHQKQGYKKGRKDLQKEVKGFFKNSLGFSLPEGHNSRRC